MFVSNVRKRERGRCKKQRLSGSISETVLTANLLAANSRFYRSNVMALKNEDSRPDQVSIPPGPHHHVTIIQQIIH